MFLLQKFLHLNKLMNNISFGQLVIIALLLALLFTIKQVFESVRDQLFLRKIFVKKKITYASNYLV